MKEETRGGILHWGRESEEEGAVEIGHLRDAIRKAFGGRAPRVLDPFAGGGAIPLEAIRLGCEAVAADLNPVAWFILRCTLHYPHRLAGQARALPEFALRDRRFAEGFLKARGITGKTALREELARVGHGDGEPVQVDSLRTDDDEAPASSADLAWHLRACGERVLDEVRRGLAARYPTYAEFEPVRRKGRRRTAARPPKLRYHPRPARLLVPDEHGHVSAASLNAEFDTFYLEERRQPALDCEAARCLARHAQRTVQRLPSRDPALEDALAVPEGEQARAADAAPAEGGRPHRLRGRARSSGGPWKRRSRGMARGIAGVSRTVDQPPGRSRLCAGDLAKRSRKDPQHVRPLRTSHGLGLRGILPRGRYHRRLHPGRRVGGPCRRAHRSRRHGRACAELDATLRNRRRPRGTPRPAGARRSRRGADGRSRGNRGWRGRGGGRNAKSREARPVSSPGTAVGPAIWASRRRTEARRRSSTACTS